jgi:hypothetical protein
MALILAGALVTLGRACAALMRAFKPSDSFDMSAFGTFTGLDVLGLAIEKQRQLGILVFYRI